MFVTLLFSLSVLLMLKETISTKTEADISLRLMKLIHKEKISLYFRAITLVYIWGWQCWNLNSHWKN